MMKFVDRHGKRLKEHMALQQPFRGTLLVVVASMGILGGLSGCSGDGDEPAGSAPVVFSDPTLRDAMLDEEEARTGVRLGTAYHAMNSVANSLYFNMDVETWIREGLVDHCIVHPTHSVEPNMPDPGDFTPEFLTQYVEMARGTACKVYADVYPRRMPAEDYRRKAITYYDAGVDGLSLWDTHTRRSRCSEWSMIHLLGHRDELSSWGERTKDVFRKTHCALSRASPPTAPTPSPMDDRQLTGLEIAKLQLDTDTG